MFSQQIPVFNSTAGPGNDGVVIGSVNQSAPTAVLLGESLVSIAQVLRKDVTTSGTTWTDLTTVATDAAAGDFQPFGAVASMSLGDSSYVRTLNDEDTHHFYAQIAVPGVGTWTVGLQEWNEATDAWENVTGLVDASNGFKAAIGVYKISYTSGAEGKVRLDDVSPKYVWHRFVLTAFTSATTAPVLSRIWSAKDTLAYKNVTVAHTSTNFSSLPTDILPRIGDCLLTVNPGPSYGEDSVITRSASANYTSELFYLADDNTYKPLTGVSDETNMYRVAPSATERKTRHTLPADWSSKSITDKDAVVHTGHITCMRITAIATEGPVQPPQVNCKTRSFGAGLTTGIKMYAATVIKAISFIRIGIPSVTEVTAQLLNMDNGKGSSFTIPANATSYSTAVVDLAIAANESLGMAQISASGDGKDISVLIHHTP